jgi:hypothetical protein
MLVACVRIQQSYMHTSYLTGVVLMLLCVVYRCVTGKVASQRVIMWMLRLQVNKVDTYKLCEGLGQSGRPLILKEIDSHSTELLHTVSEHLLTISYCH